MLTSLLHVEYDVFADLELRYPGVMTSYLPMLHYYLPFSLPPTFTMDLSIINRLEKFSLPRWISFYARHHVMDWTVQLRFMLCSFQGLRSSCRTWIFYWPSHAFQFYLTPQRGEACCSDTSSDLSMLVYMPVNHVFDVPSADVVSVAKKLIVLLMSKYHEVVIDDFIFAYICMMRVAKQRAASRTLESLVDQRLVFARM